MVLGCTVVSTMTRAKLARAAPRRSCVATARLSANSVCSRPSPSRLRQRVIEERSRATHAGSIPRHRTTGNTGSRSSAAHGFVGQVEGMLEIRQARHQARRQRRPAGAVGVHRTELLFQKSPVDRPRQLHQRVVHVDDLVEPRTKQILLAALPPLPWPHRNPSDPIETKRITASRFEGIPNANLQENRCPIPNFRQIQSPKILQFLLPVSRFGIFHGRLLSKPRSDCLLQSRHLDRVKNSATTT